MATISAVLIVRDEAAALDDCLASLAWVDEIVVLDSGSTDATLDVARRHDACVHVAADWRGFGIQRQRAQAHASGDWILMIDADERVTPALRASIEAAVARDDRDAVYALPRLSWVFGRFIRHSGWYPDYVTRLYPRARARYGDELVHERLQVPEDMRRERLAGDLLHFTYRDLEHYLVKSARYARDWASVREQRGVRTSLVQGLLHAAGCFLRMYVLKAGFLDGPQGFLLAALSSHSTFVKYADLWVRRQPPAEGADGPRARGTTGAAPSARR